MKLKADDKAALQARVKTLKDELLVLNANADRGTDQEKEENKAQIAIRESELESGEAKLSASDLTERNETLEAALVEQRTKDAEAAIQAAVKRGAIAIKDEATQNMWREKLISDPSNMVLLTAMRGRPALENSRIIVNGVKIVREDSVAVLNAFGAERDPNKRAMHYAEIRKRMDEGDPMPLHAGNNPGTLVGTLVSQRTLELLQFSFPVLSSISTDFSDQNGKLNQTIDTRIISVPAAVDYNAVTGWADSDAIATDVPVTMDKQKGVQITFTAADLAGTARRLFDEFGEAQAYSLAKAMVDDLYSLFTAANYAAVISASQIDFGRSTLIDLGIALDNAGVPDGPTNRFCLLNSAYFGQLKKDPAIVSLSAFQDKTIIEQGVLPDVEGFRVIKAVNLPVAENLVGFAGSRSSVAMAARLDGDYSSILPGANNGNVTTVTNPKIGLSILQVQWVDHQKAWARQRISLIFGSDKGQVAAASRLKSA